MSSFQNDVKWQGVRNKIYAVATLVVAALVIFGVIDEAQREGVLLGFYTLVENVEGIVALVIGVLAWAKSRTSKVTVVEVPAKPVNDALEGRS